MNWAMVVIATVMLLFFWAWGFYAGTRASETPTASDDPRPTDT